MVALSHPCNRFPIAAAMATYTAPFDDILTFEHQQDFLKVILLLYVEDSTKQCESKSKEFDKTMNIVKVNISK